MNKFLNLSVLTWNIWFSRYGRHIRHEEILNISRKLEPDVICLQEVIPSFLDRVKASSYFTSRYSFSDPNLDGSTIDTYGVLIMSKKELTSKYSIIPLPSVYWRKLVVAELNFGSDKFAVGSVHLESLNAHSTREIQLGICNDTLNQYQNSILCGDFNFCSHSNYNGRGPLENESLLRIMPEYIDLWPQLHPDRMGFTFDSAANPMIGKEERMRYDRIVYRSTPGSSRATVVWRPVKMELIGDTPIKRQDGSTVMVDHKHTENLKVPLLPSDHFGLYAEFEKTIA